MATWPCPPAAPRQAVARYSLAATLAAAVHAAQFSQRPVDSDRCAAAPQAIASGFEQVRASSALAG
eukprot:11085197-Alexandrium_andersonii.AAC.1